MPVLITGMAGIIGYVHLYQLPTSGLRFFTVQARRRSSAWPVAGHP